MGVINLESKDYILISLDSTFSNKDDEQIICQRLNIHRRKYWANLNLGSRFYTLRRSKDVPRTIQTVKQFAEEALSDLVPKRFQSILVTASQAIKSRIDLVIEVANITGEKQKIMYFVPVGG
ncbi:phage GP46 family protein [Acinetobacter gerneri]|uniref:phage GP46 family protein n=1 Tax=Acinetobacter gerneri TaxID=202952 RepID=UPI0029367950|nr:phage GP46 family protein [Acinetobacter gerneri]MDV2438713.1 phage GP46 family protein [Acinetobacter gerneri]